MISELVEKIKLEILSGDFSLQAVFDRNIETIETLKKEGYSYKRIFQKLDSDLHEKHFNDLIWRAKKKITPVHLKENQNNNIRKSPPNQSSNDIEAPKEVDIRIDEWGKHLGYPISERLYGMIKENNICKSEIDKFKVPNTRKLIAFINEYSNKNKYRK
ncbi:hypothetical protein AB4396_06930 [Vibrio cyclitrophicus]